MGVRNRGRIFYCSNSSRQQSLNFRSARVAGLYCTWTVCCFIRISGKSYGGDPMQYCYVEPPFEEVPEAQRRAT
jgi:hypothetical protein